MFYGGSLIGSAYLLLKEAENEDESGGETGWAGLCMIRAGNGSVTYDGMEFTVKPIPEPTTMLLLGTGLAGIGAIIKRRRQGK
jgi:hypothetical protein